jgi:nucleotide-binding universal stress UspA family protein
MDIMKTLLVLTDFTNNATHAAKMGAVWTERLHADILLFNTFYDHPIILSHAGGPWVVEDFVYRKDESLTKLAHLAVQIKDIIEVAENYKPAINFQCGEGSLGANILTILQEKEIDMIVMGASLNSALNHAFFGSDTMEVINNVDCPVIVIPQKAEMKTIQKVTIATAFEIADINAIDYLVTLSQQLKFQMEIVHVSISGQSEDKTRVAAFRTHISYLEGVNVTYKQIKGKNVVDRLNKLCKNNDSDMLALIHYEHGFLSTVFNKCNTEQALANQHLPLMILPSQLGA